MEAYEEIKGILEEIYLESYRKSKESLTRATGNPIGNQRCFKEIYREPYRKSKESSRKFTESYRKSKTFLRKPMESHRKSEESLRQTICNLIGNQMNP